MAKLYIVSALVLAMGYLIPQTVEATPYFRLTLQSAPGDWVGGGQSYEYDDFANWTVTVADLPMEYLDGFQITTVPDNSGFANEISFNIGEWMAPGYFRQWTLDFQTNNTGTPIGPGKFSGAQNDVLLLGSPRIDIYGNDTPNEAGRGCDGTFGSFAVTTDPISIASGQIAFAATFVQHCEQSDAPPLSGSIVYYSDGLPDGAGVPEPASVGSMAAGAAVLTAVVRTKKRPRSQS